MAPNTFESEWAQRWRALEEMEGSQKEALDKQFKEAREKLESEMDQAIQEHETMLMRQGTTTGLKTSHLKGYCHGNFVVFCKKLLKNVTKNLFSNMTLLLEHHNIKGFLKGRTFFSDLAICFKLQSNLS